MRFFLSLGLPELMHPLLAQIQSSTELLPIISKRVEGSQFLNEYSVEGSRFKYHTTFECAYTFDI